MTWTAPQAEAWMLTHPGRWLESVSGALWCWTGLVFRRLLPGEGASLGGWPRLPAEAGDFHPPREHYAAEREALRGELERLCNAYLMASDPEQGRFYELAMALFHAAPEVEGE